MGNDTVRLQTFPAGDAVFADAAQRAWDAAMLEEGSIPHTCSLAQVRLRVDYERVRFDARSRFADRDMGEPPVVYAFRDGTIINGGPPRST